MAYIRDEREPSIEGGTAYDDFIARVQAFYYQRGTPFDARPKVGTRHVDLYALYNRVTGLGGYDAVSDTKSNKLAWRSIGQEFNLGTTNLPALAFNLKSVYYRFLAAFEIVDFHQRIPPPREILEDVSAKGANILNRTLENYKPPAPRRKDRIAGSQDVDGSEGDDGGTPIPDRMEVDEPQSLGRGGRNLRQAPPQRVLFQSDVTTRSSRNVPASPTPGSTYPSGTSNGYNSNLPMTLANYEPKQQVPLTLRAVNTPSNNPEAFKLMELARRDAILAKYPASSRQPKGMMLPGTGFTGPSIYIRTLLSLQSGVLEEQEYALHHLVKISHERGDKYRFDGFSGLAEALIEKVLEIGTLLAGKQFHISYDYNSQNSGPDTLDGLYGTPHILDKARVLGSTNLYDRMESSDFARRLCLINEAGLVLRNMVMLEENADFIAKYPAMRDLVVILISLSEHSATSELRQYGFDLAEQLSRYIPANPEEPLLQALIALIDDTDRAVVVSSLRSLSRMGTQLGELMPIQSIPIPTLIRICDWLLVEDYELRTVCLDLLYRYTVVVSNVEELLDCFDVEVLIRRIVRLLLHAAKTVDDKAVPIPTLEAHQESTPAENPPIPKLPVELVEQLLLFEEPERSSHWLRTCFEESPSGEITQIALWQAYQIPFAPFAATRPLLPAKDFITNVSTTFSAASAQVMPGVPPRFVIKGIRPRSLPVDPQGRVYEKCLWRISPDEGNECGEFAEGGKGMWEHIVQAHLGITKDEQGAYILDPLDTVVHHCCWAGCSRFDGIKAAPAYAVGMHVKTHMPDNSSDAARRKEHNIAGTDLAMATQENRAWPMHTTLTDEHYDAVGLPLTAVLVLRNLARLLPQTSVGFVETTERDEDGNEEKILKRRENIVWTYFGGIKEELYYVMAHNQPLREYLAPLVSSIVA